MRCQQVRLGRGELGAVVHAAQRDGLPGELGDAALARLRGDRHEVGEVELALRVLRRDAPEGRARKARSTA
jgi:hypothetical protein